MKTGKEAGIEFLIAVRLGKIEEAARIIENNSKVLNSVDEYNTNALLYALKGKHVDLAKLLIEKGINTSHTDILGDNVRTLANRFLDEHEAAAICDIVLEKEAELWKKLAERQKAAHRDNPFNCTERPYFYCFDITACDTAPFPDLENCVLFNGNQVNTYVGSIILTLTVSKESSGNIMNPSTHTKTDNYAQAVIIDLLPSPVFEDLDYLGARKQWRKDLLADQAFSTRMAAIKEKAIMYFADYDISKILAEIEFFAKN